MTTATAVRRAETGARFYRPELDVVRFGAFALVFLHHALSRSSADYVTWGVSPWVGSAIAAAARAGAWGVDLFFALSAYLITELLSREQRARGTIDIRAFYLRRILRIWPLYYFTLLVLLPALSRFVPGERLPVGYYLGFLFLSGNWVCALWGYPLSAFALLWSVSIEEQFYLAWPWLIRFAGHRLPMCAWGLMAVANVTRLILVIRGVVHPGIWCDTLARLDPIACGALLACTLRGATPGLSRRARFLWVGSGAALLWMIGAVGDPDGWRALFSYPLAAAASVAILYGSLTSSTFNGPVARSSVYLGKISYGLYVFHVAAIRLAPSPLLAFPLTVALASISYRFLESPFLRLKKRYTRTE